MAALASPLLGGAGYAPGGSTLTQLGVQALGVAAVCLWSGLASAAIVFLCRALVGLRENDEAIEEGLDMASHGERAYTI